MNFIIVIVVFALVMLIQHTDIIQSLVIYHKLFLI